MALHYAALRDSVCLEVRGADAAAFLHGQLSQAVAELDPERAPLAAWADARGRVRALLRVYRLPTRWLLVTPRDGADELAKKLRLFVLRSKVAIERANDVEVAALVGDADGDLRRYVDTSPNRLVRRGDTCLVRVGPRYCQVVAPPAALASLAADLDATGEAAATLAEITLGIPAITAALADRFVVQVLNLDELGAVAFDKGCYPGQEVIARVHNLGGVKRRARRYAAAGAPPAIGATVLAASIQVGEVIRSAPADSGCELLAVVDHAAAGAPVTCDGATLRELPLPFAVPRD